MMHAVYLKNIALFQPYAKRFWSENETKISQIESGNEAEISTSRIALSLFGAQRYRNDDSDNC